MNTYNPFDNQEFRVELAKLLDEKLTPIIEVVQDHDRQLNRGKGALAALAMIWTGFIGLMEFLVHKR